MWFLIILLYLSSKLLVPKLRKGRLCGFSPLTNPSSALIREEEEVAIATTHTCVYRAILFKKICMNCGFGVDELNLWASVSGYTSGCRSQLRALGRVFLVWKVRDPPSHTTVVANKPGLYLMCSVLELFWKRNTALAYYVNKQRGIYTPLCGETIELKLMLPAQCFSSR